MAEKKPAPRKREESTLLAEIRLAIGARPDIIAARINTGVFQAPDGSGRRIRSAPTGYADLPITQLRRVMAHRRVETNFSIHEKNEWFYYGQAIYIETKRARDGRLSDEQVDFGRAVEAVGGIFLAPTSVEEVLELLGPVEPWMEDYRAAVLRV